MNDEIMQFMFYKAEDFFFRKIGREVFEFDGIANAYVTGVNFEGLNILVLKNYPSDFNSIFSRCFEIFNQYEVPWSVVIQEKFCEKELNLILEKNKFKCTDESVGMIFDLNQKIIFFEDSDVVIKRIYKDELGGWITPLIEAFGSSKLMTKQYKICHEKIINDELHFYHFSLFKKNTPIASLTLSINGEIARLDDVGTLPAFQKRGYATQLLVHALQTARMIGAKYCFLESSESGLSIYKKIGFRPFFRNRIYTGNGD